MGFLSVSYWKKKIKTNVVIFLFTKYAIGKVSCNLF